VPAHDEDGGRARHREEPASLILADHAARERALALTEAEKAEHSRRRAETDRDNWGLHLEVAQLHDAAARLHERAAATYDELAVRRARDS
jgi:hypothetical protein